MGEKSTRKNKPKAVDKLRVAEQVGRSIEFALTIRNTSER